MIENFRYNYNWLKIFVGFSPELSLSSRVQWRKMFGCWSVNSGLMLRIKKKGVFVPLYSIKKYVYLHYLALEILILLSLPFLSVQLANQTRIWADFRRRFLSVLATPKDSERLETDIERRTWVLTVMNSIFLTETKKNSLLSSFSQEYHMLLL